MNYLEMAQNLGYEECVDLEPYGSVDLVEVNELEQEQAHQWLYDNNYLPAEKILDAIYNKKCVKMYDWMNYNVSDEHMLFLSKSEDRQRVFNAFMKEKLYRWEGSSELFNGLIINPKEAGYTGITKFI